MIPLAAINQLAAVYRGRGRNEAYLEFAQEHFLDWLRLEGLFEDDAVVFKVRCATMSHMERVGVRELRRDASAILRRVAAGETVEVTDRGRPVAVLLKTMPSGLARLEREGLLRRAEAGLLDLVLVQLPPDATAPSRLVAEGRAD